MRRNIRCYRAIRTIRVVLSRHEEELDTREKRLRRHTATDLHLSVVCLPIRVFFFVSFVLSGSTSLIETEIITAIANVGEQIRCRIIVERGFWRNDEILENRNKDCT